MEPKTISAGEYLAIRAQQQSARARAADARTQSAGETAAPRTVAGDDNTGDDTKMSSPTKTAIDSLVDQDMRDDSSLSSQTKTANPSAGEGDTASSTAAERRSRCAERSPTPEVDYGSSDDESEHSAKGAGSDDKSEHGASGETKATSQSHALSFSPSFAASASPYSPPFSLADGSVKEEGEVDANLDRSDRDEGVLVTNSTQETEERAAYSTVEFQPWFPSSWIGLPPLLALTSDTTFLRTPSLTNERRGQNTFVPRDVYVFRCFKWPTTLQIAVKSVARTHHLPRFVHPPLRLQRCKLVTTGDLVLTPGRTRTVRLGRVDTSLLERMTYVGNKCDVL